MNFIGTAKRLNDVDLPTIAKTIGVGEDELHAIIDTETRGTGFDSQNRPIILFEPHIFYRLLKAEGSQTILNLAVSKGLAYPVWGTKPYPKDSYPVLTAAASINFELALRSASWGLGQIMGFNYSMAGYTSAELMVEAFKNDEEYHLKALVKFIVSAGLDDDLRRHDWAGFARGYNGAGFAKNGYDTKLASRFAVWQKIKDTPIG